MEIKAADVMKLRKMTGAGMMDCKNALIGPSSFFEAIRASRSAASFFTATSSIALADAVYSAF